MELIATEENKSQIREGYKKTEVGIIPDDWIVTTVGEVFEVCNNLRLPISDSVRKTMQGIYPYYGPTRIQDYINEYRVEGEYALIGEDGDHFLKFNDIPMTQLASGRFNVNNHAHLIKGKAKATTTKWFYYFFKHRDITQYLSRQGAGRYKLNKSTLLSLPCAIPPTIQEQEAISNAIADADAFIGNLDKLITKKKAIKQGAMQQLLIGKSRLSSFIKDKGYKQTAIGSIPNDWDAVPIGEILSFKNGLNKASEFFGYGTPIVNYMDVYSKNGLTSQDVKGKVSVTKQELQNYSANKGDVFFTRTSETVEEIGTAAVLSENIEDCVFSGFVLRGREKKKILDDSYKKYCFSSSVVRRQIISTSSYTTRALTNGKLLSAVYLPVPRTLAEQKAIATLLSDMDAELENLEKKKAKYQHIKQGMMQELLTGKTRLV